MPVSNGVVPLPVKFRTLSRPQHPAFKLTTALFVSVSVFGTNTSLRFTARFAPSVTLSKLTVVKFGTVRLATAWLLLVTVPFLMLLPPTRFSAPTLPDPARS